MSKFSISRELPYSPQKVFELVSDVRSYPQFIPWITQLHTYNHQENATGYQFDADVCVGFKLLSESFSTRVTCDQQTRSVTMGLIRGPFRRLLGQWSFAPIDKGSIITLNMDIDITNPLLKMLFKANFERAVSRIIGVFENRAKDLFQD